MLADNCPQGQEWKIEIFNNLIKDNKLKIINNQKNMFSYFQEILNSITLMVE